MNIKHKIVEDKTILQNKYLNSTIPTDILVDHNIVLVHVTPQTDSIKLVATDPNGDTFSKESKDGFVYDIIEKKAQAEGNYSISIYNLNDESVNVNVVLGEDPFLSGKCDPNNSNGCFAIPLAIGFVIGGIIAFIVGAILAITDFQKQRKKQ